MKKQTVLWIFGVVVTLLTAYYQRKTGPTKPVSQSVEILGETIESSLPRSHGGETDREIRVTAVNNEMEGKLVYKRYGADQQPDTLPMARVGSDLVACLPGQPPAGKLEYQVILSLAGQEAPLNEVPVVIRFKGDVPALVLIPHILFIFAAQLLSLMAGLYAIYRFKKYKIYGALTMVFLIAGGFILGPIMQKFAFGAYWTGFPFGQDLTDNKVLFAMVFWILAVAMNIRKERRAYTWIAAAVFFLINMIPHSVMGSELDYESGEILTGMILLF